MQFAPMAAIVGIGAALWYGAFTDAKTRTVPNWVSILIFILGCFTSTPWPDKLFGSVVMIILSIILEVGMKVKAGGADIKLRCALSFAMGLFPLAFMLLLTIIFYKVHRGMVLKQKQEKGETLPLCSFLAPAYTVYIIGYSILIAVLISMSSKGGI